MSHQRVNNTLSSHLALLGLPTQFENGAYAPVNDVTYVAELYLPSQTGVIGLEVGSSEQFKGLYQMNVHAPRDKGKFFGRSMAEALINQFKRGTQIEGNSLVVLCERTDELASVLMGDRWVTGVRVTYSCITKAQ